MIERHQGAVSQARHALRDRRTITYDPAAKDLSVEVAKAKATKAELLMPVSRLNDAKLMVQEMVKQRWEPMGVMNPGAPGLYEQDFLKTMGKYGDFLISNVPWLDPKTAMTQALEKRHAAQVPQRPARHQRRLHLRGAC